MARIGRRADLKTELKAPIAIPDRLYYRIGEVARICGVATTVLRFWETQFPQLKPNKGGTGQRLYRRREVELALRIHELVHEQGFTIAGAKQVIAAPAEPIASQNASLHGLREIRAGLKELREMLLCDAAPNLRRKPRVSMPSVQSETPTLFSDFDLDQDA